MDITFDNKTPLKDLQESFKKRFNFLKIEFFKFKEGDDPAYTVNDLLNPELRIEDVSPTTGKVSLHITGLMKVGELERNFSEKLGIHVQVFRKSGKVWLITSSSDALTLDELNRDARERENKLAGNNEESDYHEQE